MSFFESEKFSAIFCVRDCCLSSIPSGLSGTQSADFKTGFRSHVSFFLFFLVYLFLAALGLRCCAWALLGCSKRVLQSSCAAQASRWGDFSCCRAWALGLPQLSLVAPQQEESSWSRDQTCVPCTGRLILNGWTTTKVPRFCFKKIFFHLFSLCSSDWIISTNLSWGLLMLSSAISNLFLRYCSEITSDILFSALENYLALQFLFLHWGFLSICSIWIHIALYSF